jgi:hypothetical protein
MAVAFPVRTFAYASYPGQAPVFAIIYRGENWRLPARTKIAQSRSQLVFPRITMKTIGKSQKRFFPSGILK